MDTFHCLWMTSGYTSVTICSAAETPQDKPGQHKDSSGCLKDAPMGIRTLRRLGEITDGVYGSFFSPGCQLIISDFYDNIKMSWWTLVTTGYLDPNAYKQGKG